MHWTTDAIRQSFLDFFARHGHRIEPSAPLIPKGDPTLLFTNAGMVPFKDYFLGLRTPPVRRVADCQKCLRISGKHNDLEAVGRDTYHHTFFEMLGNWSFGDYYKAEAIAFHWELVTKVWGLKPERLWATVYTSDEEAYEAWRALRVLPAERILRFGEADNFWEMGETGPCGPCSEIHIDRGGAACDGRGHQGQPCAVNVEGCARFIELANLVFIQYNRDAQGVLTPLPMTHVDTGTGLERVAAVLQSEEVGHTLGNYDIDLFQIVIGRIAQLVDAQGSGATYGQGPDLDISYRAIADHSRAVAFLAAEGLRPGKNGQEYVLRRLIRRASWHGRRLGLHTAFLSEVCETVVDAMGRAYPELVSHQATIREVVSAEEEQFSTVVEAGLKRIRDFFTPPPPGSAFSIGGRTLPGNLAFELHDTYGFPIDLTQAVCRDYSGTVDLAGFEQLMEQQRARARGARKENTDAPELRLTGEIRSRFVGYHDLSGESEVLAVHEGEQGRIELVTAETPFYPEGGGQVGDRGVISGPGGAQIEVLQTRKADGAIVHVGVLRAGNGREFAPGVAIRLAVDKAWRTAAMLNHSATHILHSALRERLGTSVHQAGSYVGPERMRFDFSHTGAVSSVDLQEIEAEVNQRIRADAPVTVEEMAYPDALASGALAFFGDKYGDRVRVVRMGDFSVELCGGTHVARTGEIGLFKLTGESGVAAGVRRIEAQTGAGALETVRRREALLREIGEQLRAPDEAALERLQRLLAHEKELERKLRSLEAKLAAGTATAPAQEQVRELNGIKLVTRKLIGVEAAALRPLADQLRQQLGSAVVVLGSVMEDKVALLAAVTPDLTSRVKAGDLIKHLAPMVGGSGGGRADFAQAGGHLPAKLDQALDEAGAWLGRR
ncbi:MAG TPA: alanine--tRNA ligase [Candidatus Binataceae bacterium]|nr:alanine--tRNA ligase [Candidatus Binataceae bacterium]